MRQTIGLLLFIMLANSDLRVVIADEKFERDVDQAALESQEKAADQLSELLVRHRGSPTEADLLSRLADVQEQTAAMQFRIAHGHSHLKAVDLTKYHLTLKQAVNTWSNLITRFPAAQQLTEAYFGRGKAQEELGMKELAKRDYEFLVSRFPNARVAVSAYMSLAELEIVQGNQAKAIADLAYVEKQKEDPHYPLALYKTAWCYYNLGDVNRALSYLQKNIEYYSHQSENIKVSDVALQENSYLDAAVFMFEGYERKISDFSLTEVMARFKKLSRGAILDRMILKYAKLLRAHGLGDTLVAWKNLAQPNIQSESIRRDLLLIVFQEQVYQRRYSEMVQTAHEMIGLHVDSTLLETAEILQKEIVRNKNADGVGKLTIALAGIYDAYTQSVPPSDPRLAKIHYNLAETFYQTKDFEKATENYRWILDHEKNLNRDPELLKDASKKAVASRYEALLVRGLIPTQLVPKPLSSSHPLPISTSGDLALALEWVGWVDFHRALYHEVETGTGTTDNFYFEASRCLYQLGNIRKAVSRLQDFALASPSSQYAKPSASLVLDTFVASSDWSGLIETAKKFLAVQEWKASEFSQRLKTQATEASYKLASSNYQNGKYEIALTQAESSLAINGDRQDLVVIAGNSAAAMHRPDKAFIYFSKLISVNPDSDAGRKAILARASLYEGGDGSYRFLKAAQDYRLYLRHAGAASDLGDIKKRSLLFAWLSGDFSFLVSLLKDFAVCGESVALECDRYRGLVALSEGAMSRTRATTDHALSRARMGFSGNSPIWSAIALEGAKYLGFRDRNLAISLLSSHWGELDSLIASSLVPSIVMSIPGALALNRRSVSEISPLVGATGRTERYIQDRMFRIHEFESAAAEAEKLPWSRIRALALNETAEVYLDAARSLQDPQLSLPFGEKGQELRAKAFQVASRFGIEDDSFLKIATPFFSDNPTQAKILKAKEKFERPRPIDLFTLETFADATLVKDSEEGARKLRENWSNAIKAKSWQQVSFYLKVAKERALLSPGLLQLMKAVSLVSMNAQGEGLLEFAQARESLPLKTKINMTLVLLANYLADYSRERTQELLQDYRKFSGTSPNQNPTRTSVAALADQWMGG